MESSKPMNPAVAWKAALGELQLQMTRATFDTWLKESRFLAYDEEHKAFFITVSSAYAKDWLENRLHRMVQRVLENITGLTCDVRFVVWNDQEVKEQPLLIEGGTQDDVVVDTEPEPQSRPQPQPFTQFNWRYTFDSFVVGSNNRLAHAAALAASENPARAYNPLFIYGGVGLGKTHLLQAIGHACQQKGLNVLYASSEDFTNDLVRSIRSHTTEELRAKYRTPDVLLLDDIQFVAGKERTQEELFHTFNALHAADKQIVISSDRPPKAMARLEERLKSRFEWGLIADVQSPDLETRLAILQTKAEGSPYHLSDDLLNMIAYYIRSNIRELEGALNKVVAYCQLTGEQPTVQLAEAAMADLVNRSVDLTPEIIAAKVADYYGISTDDLMSKTRSRRVARPRQLAMYLAREETSSSLPQIGRALGGRDHTTVMYGCEKIQDLLETDPALNREMLEIKTQLYDHQTTH